MQSFQEYITQVLSEAGLTDQEVTQALGKLYANEKVGPKLNALVKTATEDYNAQLGRAQAAQQRLDKLEKEWYPQANQQYLQMQQQYQKVLAELEQARNGGNGTGFEATSFDATKYVSKDDLQRYDEDRAGRFARVLKETNAITASHVSRFKDTPDFEAIDKLATEHQIPLKAAYEKWIEPRVEEERKKSNEEWKKQQREEIERDVRSRYQLPVDHTPPETPPIYQRLKPEDLPKDLDADLLATWHGVNSK
jgi:thymidylate kinase